MGFCERCRKRGGTEVFFGGRRRILCEECLAVVKLQAYDWHVRTTDPAVRRPWLREKG